MTISTKECRTEKAPILELKSRALYVCVQVSSAISLSGCMSESSLGQVEPARNCLQWQMNLLTHIEDVQNQVAGRMDLIEKELDGKIIILPLSFLQ